MKKNKSSNQFNARRELVVYGQMFATQFGKYELVYEPHLLGSMINVRSKAKDEFCGTYLLADAPAGFIVALATAVKELQSL